MTAARRKLVESGFLGVAKAAAFLGVDRKTVYTLCRGGVLSSSTHGGKRVIPMQALHDYADKHLQIGSVA